MMDLTAGTLTTVDVAIGKALTIDATNGIAMVVPLPNGGGEPGTPIFVVATKRVFGPYSALSLFEIVCNAGKVSYSVDVATAAGSLTETGIAAALAAKSLTDAQGRTAIGNAASVAAGLRAIGLTVVADTPAPTPTPTPAITPLPSGIVASWDASTLSALADGAVVPAWTDSTAGITATYTGDSGAKHTYIKDSGGGLPAVRLSGVAVLATNGTNAAATALQGAENGVIIVARRFMGTGAGQANPVIVATSDNTTMLFQGTPTQTGRYQAMYDCADAGIRVLGNGSSGSRNMGFDCINATAIYAAPRTGNQVYIGGWQNANNLCCGIADVLAVFLFGRPVTAADFKQVRRRFCQLASDASYPAGKNVSFLGDSLTAGYDPNLGAVDQLKNSYAGQMVKALNLPWGQWDQMGVSGITSPDIRQRVLPQLGDISTATGKASAVAEFEFANERADSNAIQAQRDLIDAARAQDAKRYVIFGSSTYDGSNGGTQTEQNRKNFNAFWDVASNRTGIDAYVPIHLDPNIGVTNAIASGASGNTFYQNDNEHLTKTGYGLLDNGQYGFRSAVQAFLSAP